MVPDCFHCTNPCGRTAALGLNVLKGESWQIREAKFAILREMRSLAASARSQKMGLKLYRNLVILGLEGYSPEELTGLFESS